MILPRCFHSLESESFKIGNSFTRWCNYYQILIIRIFIPLILKFYFNSSFPITQYFSLLSRSNRYQRLFPWWSLHFLSKLSVILHFSISSFITSPQCCPAYPTIRCHSHSSSHCWKYINLVVSSQPMLIFAGGQTGSGGKWRESDRERERVCVSVCVWECVSVCERGERTRNCCPRA